MAGEESRISNSVLQVQINSLGIQLNTVNDQIKGGFDDIKDMLKGFDERLRCVENSDAGNRPVMLNRIQAVEEKAKQNRNDIEELKNLIILQSKSIDKLKDSFDSLRVIFKWMLGIFTTIMVAIIIMFLTGQAMVVFK